MIPLLARTLPVLCIGVLCGQAQTALTVRQSGLSLLLSWPVPSPGYQLQVSTSLQAAAWSAITNGPVINGSENQFQTNLTAPALFFRLVRPSSGCDTNATDLPDAQYLDSDCDGIDGDLRQAFFVVTDGVDQPGQGTLLSPFRTIGYAIQRAQESGKTQVLIQAGTYAESVSLPNGIGLYGGFDRNWNRAAQSSEGHLVQLVGGFDASSGQFLTVSVRDTTLTNHLADLTIRGPDVPDVAPNFGLSSYGIYASNAALVLERVIISGGSGASGAPGANGVDAPQLPASVEMAGTAGGSAAEYDVNCDDFSSGAGGAAGANPQDASGQTRAGAGGAGGTMDTSCNIFSLNYNATAGLRGTNAVMSVGGYGVGGAGGAANSPFPGQNGIHGDVLNGALGAVGSGFSVSRGFFQTAAGGSGGVGQNGGGGGGGGGSGGNDAGVDSYGAGGGGGGAGGMAAVSGGAGGDGAGSSFDVLALNCTLSLTDTLIQRGSGGRGGVGGVGGRGQSGGLGGAGGAAGGDSPAGGYGGEGAHGGHGGGGGGGQGGYAVGIACQATVLVTNNLFFAGGTKGLGGEGGASAPGAPPADQDGNPGSAGDDGQLLDLLQLP